MAVSSLMCASSCSYLALITLIVLTLIVLRAERAGFCNISSCPCRLFSNGFYSHEEHKERRFPFKNFVKKSDHPVGGPSVVRLTSPPTALVQQFPSSITYRAHQSQFIVAGTPLLEFHGLLPLREKRTLRTGGDVLIPCITSELQLHQ